MFTPGVERFSGLLNRSPQTVDSSKVSLEVDMVARIGAVVAMNVEDYCVQSKRWWFRLQEKGGRHHDVPDHHTAEEYVDAYLAAAGLREQRSTPLFRCIDNHR